MSLRDLVVEEARKRLGIPYNSMDDGRQGYGCAMLVAACLNAVLATDYYGSVYEFAAEAFSEEHRQGHGYDGREFERVTDPEPGDVVLYRARGYDGTDAEDYGHAALYIGNGMVIGSYGSGNIGQPDYFAGKGVCETTVEFQSLGNGWMYVRCKRLYDDGKSPRNDCGMRYRAHVQGLGWMASVRDGMRAGTEGACRRMEALKMTPPDGVELEVVAHLQGIGDKVWRGIRKGQSSGTGSSENDPIIGTVGESRRLEGLSITVARNDGPCRDKSIRYMGHVQDGGWTRVCRSGEFCGTRGKGKRLEAVRIWFE